MAKGKKTKRPFWIPKNRRLAERTQDTERMGKKINDRRW